ncbi:hypothetical protein FE257_005343 [Aspergillus nanangensis]|uniref:Ima1 N-terminal domain-containing protein n=1 Tax=Aspergillus nanangensis TaxID=2582783 RepID=A0AAD4CA89_ASPNN|nr:hypothetical protein FE257_005343 [Aspergillus nanangensis]
MTTNSIQFTQHHLKFLSTWLEMAHLFAKRLTCFYCGSRSPQKAKGPVRKFRCNHCEAINHLDEKGEITDPPAAETNPDVYGPGASSPPFEGSDFTGSGLFCTQCVRNQHLFTSALASYFPPPDDPNYSAYEREYPKFRQNLEERYPQVCVRCEPLARERIRQAGYEAKSDHLRRMMDRSKAGRVARQARNWNWRSLLIFAGAFLHWASIVGQLSWNLWTALGSDDDALRDPDEHFTPQTTLLCIQNALKTGRVTTSCSADLAPYAGLALVAGIFSLWYNPKLRLKVEGRGGRFAGLGEYYKVQLIVLVVRCAFWAVLRDPSSSGLDPTLPPALHMFMIFFTILSIAISRRIVKYDTRPLVNWNEDTPVSSPTRQRDRSPIYSTSKTPALTTALETSRYSSPRFPLEKLATPRAPVVEQSIPTPPPEGDDMDWTPSVQQRVIKPTTSVHQRDQKSVLEGPLPFYGSLPAAPKPPSWALRNQSTQRPKPIEQAVEHNPFHRTPNQPSSSWDRSARSDAIFAPPKFFPTSDHAASTGLESLFDKTFTIKSPEDEEENTWQSQQRSKDPRTRYNTGLQTLFIFQYLRLGLLGASIVAWFLSENGHLSLPGNYIEVASLGSASLIAGFALLETLKHPIAQWNGMEILVYFAELLAAVHLGGNLPRGTYERQYFDRYGKLLLIFMAAQEALTLLSLYRLAAHPEGPGVQQSQQLKPSGGGPINSPRAEHHGHPDLQHSFASHSAAPAMSFSSTAADSSFSTQPPEPQYRLAFPTYDAGFKRDHSFSLNSLKENESDGFDPLDRDSDTETTVTTATTATNNTIRNIRYGRHTDDVFFSPKRSELGPGIGGLSLDDGPSRRMTRSQSRRLR